MDGRDVDGLEGMDRFLQDPVDKVHSAILKQEQSVSGSFFMQEHELHGLLAPVLVA